MRRPPIALSVRTMQRLRASPAPIGAGRRNVSKLIRSLIDSWLAQLAEHVVAARCDIRHRLDDGPVLDNLCVVVEAEDVYGRSVPAFEVGVDGHEIALRDDAIDLVIERLHLREMLL